MPDASLSVDSPAAPFVNLLKKSIISYDSPRGGVSVITEKGDTTTSFLLIQNARPSDSGQYTCNPSNAKSKSVTVHVLNAERETYCNNINVNLSPIYPDPAETDPHDKLIVLSSEQRFSFAPAMLCPCD
uniref:Ig domain-containing protein n=1 Tax=Anopheles maculatus TaxID=74869 RepID=A0A182SIS4_9DIPT